MAESRNSASKAASFFLTFAPTNPQKYYACINKDEGFLDFLENLRLRPGAKIEILKREYDETMTLRAAGHTMHLGKPATTRIWVRRSA